MISAKSLLNFGVFIILVIRPRVRAVLVNYEKPFPHRFPVREVSRVAFTQYSDVPMLSLEEIQEGFPFLKIQSDNVADRANTRRSFNTRPQYVFYYVPTEFPSNSGGISDFHHSHGNPKPVPVSDKRYSLRNEINRSLQGKTVHSKELTRKTEPVISRFDKKLIIPKAEGSMGFAGLFKENLQPHERYRKRYNDERDKEFESTTKTINSDNQFVYVPNKKFNDRDFSDKTHILQISETRAIPNRSYPRVPSRYVQPPMVEYENKKFWVKNKRKSKRPTVDSATNEERLKNHRNASQKKSKETSPVNKTHLKNHRPVYDREHDPEELTESSTNGKAERLHRRPKEDPKDTLTLSQDGDRVEFQIHGHEGPETYIFGYDTGDGKNRHFRLEERLRDGSVKGHYGYYDANGKLKMVEYKVRPIGGYVEKHHKSNDHESDQTSNTKM
ncbi:uncharacterized protein LOC124176872 isoform X1 [Neodiprion fabricii]|uniref:uncharacterized protein LOC124176872 isoform X1 n=2 Tax=Neodiprion fabricii TaxID=2872261 RepID=UPI001ED97980|nr:uncharacterized protein LOC124176872 isoform X1 [Neodiprion fabricii]